MGDAGVDSCLEFTLPFQLTRKIHRETVPYILSDSNPDNDQSGKIVVITGGGTGIGAAAARVWVKAKARGVVIVGRRWDILESSAVSMQDVSNPGTAVLAVQADITVENDVRQLFTKVKKLFGRTADVVIANAGIATDWKLAAEEDETTWWSNFEVNVRGLRNTVVHWIQSQEDACNPVGTVINVNTGMTGLTIPGCSGYSISKLAAHRYMEFIAAVRSFTLLPGVVDTGLVKEGYEAYAVDNSELAGSLALYLSTARADYLKGSLTSVNWDYEEIETKKHKIKRGLLKMKWVPVLPCSGGQGL